MEFVDPTPFKEAIQARTVKSALPTSLGSRELSQIRSDIKERALFSARVTNTQFLDAINEKITKLATGVSPGAGEYMNPATARLELKGILESIDYKPAAGDEGTIKDLSSDGRLNLIIDTNERSAAGYGQFVQSNDPDIIDSWPAQELVRIQDRREKRNWSGTNGRWEQACRAAGDRDALKVFGETQRMIARKDSKVWSWLGSPELFDDGLDAPYPPFAFQSGMGVVDIDRDEAISIGLITESAKIEPQTRGFNDDLKLSPEIRSQQLRSALLEDIGDVAEFKGGELTLKEGA